MEVLRLDFKWGQGRLARVCLRNTGYNMKKLKRPIKMFIFHLKEYGNLDMISSWNEDHSSSFWKDRLVDLNLSNEGESAGSGWL